MHRRGCERRGICRSDFSRLTPSPEDAPRPGGATPGTISRLESAGEGGAVRGCTQTTAARNLYACLVISRRQIQAFPLCRNLMGCALFWLEGGTINDEEQPRLCERLSGTNPGAFG